MNQRFEAGQFITFTYNPPAKQAKPRPGMPLPPVSDKTKQILVLHPSWHNKIHGIDMARISPAEQQVLRAVMDPKVKAAIDAGQWPVPGAPPYSLLRDILTRMDPNELIKNPLAFYQRLVKPFIRDKDCYRQYWPQYVFGVKVVQESAAQGPPTNPKPLFKKV